MVAVPGFDSALVNNNRVGSKTLKGLYEIIGSESMGFGSWYAWPKSVCAFRKLIALSVSKRCDVSTASGLLLLVLFLELQAIDAIVISINIGSLSITVHVFYQISLPPTFIMDANAVGIGVENDIISRVIG